MGFAMFTHGADPILFFMIIMETKMETPIMENQLEKNMENDMETWLHRGL